MTLDEAIKHAEEVAEEKESEAQDLEYSKLDWRHEANQCSECAKEHRQLAEWLKELKRLKEQTRWIPMSEKLPEGMGTYLVTLEYKEHGKGVTTLWYHGNGIGWDLRVADVVVAWMLLPEPYEERVGKE